MKKIYTLLALALISGSVAAQTKKDGVRFGIRAGVNLATVAYSGNSVTQQDKDDTKTLTSFYFGGNVELPLSEAFFLQPGLSLSGKGFKGNTTLSGTVQGFPYMATVTGTRNIMYLELPVNLVYKIKNISVGVGPYAGYALSGKDKFSGSATFINPFTNKPQSEPVNVDKKLNIGNAADDDLKPLDFGINFLANYQLQNGINFGLNYGLGLANSEIKNNTNDYKASNRVLSFLVGFSF